MELVLSIALSSLVVLLAALDRLLGLKRLAEASIIVLSLTAALVAAARPMGAAWIPLAVAAFTLILLYRGEEPWR